MSKTKELKKRYGTTPRENRFVRFGSHVLPSDRLSFQRAAHILIMRIEARSVSRERVGGFSSWLVCRCRRDAHY